MTLVLLLSFNTLVIAQDSSVIDREIKEIGQEAYSLTIQYNSDNTALNELIAQLNIQNTPELYAQYQQKSNMLKIQKSKIDELAARQSFLRSEKKKLQNQTEELTISQLSEREETSIGRDIFVESDFLSSKQISLSTTQCEKLEQMRRELPHRSDPIFLTKVAAVNKQSELCYIEANVDSETGVVSGFTLINKYSKTVNPHGSQEVGVEGASRTFNFTFDGRSRQDMFLSIRDDASLTGLDSSDTLMKSIIFIPRKIFPYVDMNSSGNECCQTKVFLPTGEMVIFDQLSKEILSGVLKELPIDREVSRHTRKFARVSYTGRGITIEASRRGGSPEYTYKVPFNSNENIKQAIIKHQGKVCKVSKSVIWEGTNSDQSVYFKYNTDQEFLDEVINKTGANGCSWNLTMADII